MRFFSIVLLILFYTLTNSIAQVDDSFTELPSKDYEFSLNSPYHTVYSHLYFLQPEHYEPEIAGGVFNINNEKKASDLAVKLKQILDGEGLFVDIDVLPHESNYIDSANNLHRYTLFPAFPEIYLEKIGNKWYYSKRTTASIDEMHSRIYPLGTDFLMNLFPEYGQKEFIGLEFWQYIGIITLVLLSFLVHKILTFSLDLVIRNIISRYTRIRNDAIAVIHEISKPLSLFGVFSLIYFLEPALQIPVEVNKYIMTILRIIPPVFAIVTVYKMVDLLDIYMTSFTEKTENTLDDQLAPLVRKSLKVIVIFAGVLIILQNLNFNITTILAGISIGGLAFALAAQDTLKNFFGSLMIFIDKPFQVGDWINFTGVDGTVEEVGFRSTRVRTFANSLVSVPNGRLADMTIDNYGLRRYRRFSTTIAITYDTPTDRIEAYVKGLREIIAQHPKTRKDYYEVQLNNMGAHSLDILFYSFFDVPNWSDEIKARHEILLSIIRLADTLGIRFAFPTQTLHMEDFPERKSLTPIYDDTPEEINKKVVAFLKENEKIYKSID